MKSKTQQDEDSYFRHAIKCKECLTIRFPRKAAAECNESKRNVCSSCGAPSGCWEDAVVKMSVSKGKRWWNSTCEEIQLIK